ncbi:hypothetical protein [Solicola sp. PLA-1-18]|uniref:hypothetical protein n=1 Tax=Solicola sp. PLA-1-18 TaxID=3380532 RepID=UPI003B75DC4A
MRRLLVPVALVAAGLLTGLMAVVAHRHAVVVASLVVPWGLVLVLVTLYACTRAAAELGGPRTGAFSFGAGFVVALLLAYRPRAAGDYLVAGDLRGYGLLVGGVLVVGAGVLRGLSAPARGAPPSVAP